MLFVRSIFAPNQIHYEHLYCLPFIDCLFVQQNDRFAAHNKMASFPLFFFLMVFPLYFVHLSYIALVQLIRHSFQHSLSLSLSKLVRDDIAGNETAAYNIVQPILASLLATYFCDSCRTSKETSQALWHHVAQNSRFIIGFSKHKPLHLNEEPNTSVSRSASGRWVFI